jgi:GT2 family glycosyltransferase
VTYSTSPIAAPIALSIAIVCYHSDQRHLKQLFVSIIDAVSQLKESSRLKPIPVYFIDNAETEILSLSLFDDLQQQAAALEVNLHLLSGHGNIGYGRAHNLVLDRLDSAFHLMLNPDVVLDKHCLTEGIAYFARNQTTVMVSPSAYCEDGGRQYLCKRYPSVLTLFVRGFLPALLQKAFAKRLAAYEMRELVSERPKELIGPGVPIISGCFMLCRTSALGVINGFDEGYFLYFEDFDLSLRMAGQGKIAYVPAMQISHGGGNAAKKGIKHILMFGRSGIRFFNNHGWRWLRQ